MSEILQAVDYLKEHELLDSLRLLHCHIGSQIYDIRTVKYAVSEVTHLYAELVNQGAPMGMLDLGGGLGVDYDGTQSANPASSTPWSNMPWTWSTVSRPFATTPTYGRRTSSRSRVGHW